jgi:beta-lactamase class A
MRRRLILLIAALAALAAPAPAETREQSAMAARVQALGSGFDGHAGIAVIDLKDGWTVSWNGDDRFSQESVAKLWTVIATLDAVDAGRMAIDEEVPITRADLSVFHEPLEARVGSRVTIAELVRSAIVESDNAANDLLVRRLGGTAAVQDVIRRKGITGVAAGVQQRELQAHIAGLSWRPELDGGEPLEAARSRLDPSVREAAMLRYLADPEDGATPLAAVRALKALAEGRLLSPQSTERLLALMHSTVHGEERLNGGLERGWTLAHKTGTGQHLGPLHVGTNDVGVLTAPDGHAYAVAVLEGASSASLIVREGLMRRVAEAVVETWQAQGR